MSIQNLVKHFPNTLVFIQSRAEINYSVVSEYAQMMSDGVEFDPVSAIQDGDQIYVWDGFHRGEAAKKAGTKLAVNAQPGTKQDAEWLALSANQKHGLRRTQADEEQIARNALLKFPDFSIREIHRHTGINRRRISRIRDELIASGAIAPDNKVMVTRNGVTYRQDTTNIGNKPAQQTIKTSKMLHQALVDSPYPNQIDHKTDDTCTTTRKFSHPAFNSITNLDVAAPFTFQPKAQEFECPRCGQEKIVGVNGSRRWCLNCLAEWPTAAAFLAEVEATQDIQTPIRKQLEERFAALLTRLNEQDLTRVEDWLDDLEARLILPIPTHPIDLRSDLTTKPVLEYA